MREFEHKRKVRRVLSSPWVLVPMAVVLIFLVRGTWNIFEKERQSAAELDSAKERLAKLEDRQTTLKNGIADLQSETGIEQEIRDRYVMAKEGEREVVIVEDGNKTPTTTPAAPGFLQKIWNFFAR